MHTLKFLFSYLFICISWGGGINKFIQQGFSKLIKMAAHYYQKNLIISHFELSISLKNLDNIF